MSKGSAFLGQVRPDLMELETRHVQARVTISMCDSRGIPQVKNRFFVVTPRVDRQVTLGGSTQDRSSPMIGFEDWNLAKKGAGVVMAGRGSFTMRIQHPDIEDAYHVGCRAQKDPGGMRSPGRTPFCSTRDGVTARRWNGSAFIEIPCEGMGCKLREYHGEGRSRHRPAKTVTNIVGRLAEEDFPPLLVSVATGSDVNLREWVGLIEGTAKQWADMCDRSGMNVPMSWYGIPIRLTVFESTGDETRFPRIHFALGCDLEEVFKLSIRHRAIVAEMGDALRLPPPVAQLITPDIEHADEVEIIHPTEPEPRPSTGAMESLRRLAAVAPQQQAPEESGPTYETNPDIASALDRLALCSAPSEVEGIINETDGWHEADAKVVQEAAEKRLAELKG